MSMSLDHARKAVMDACHAFDTAAQGPSGDKEHDAAAELRDVAEGLVHASATAELLVVPIDDPVLELQRVAESNSEDGVIRDLMCRVGWIWQCARCDFDNRTGRSTCEGCGAEMVDVCREGAPDPTPDTPDNEWCRAVSPDLTFACTRHGAHLTGTQHVAGNGAGQVAAVWPNEQHQDQEVAS